MSEEKHYWRNGRNGHNGKDGKRGKRGHRGYDGKRGKRGHRGHHGAPGVSGGADFYALISENQSILPGSDVGFPLDGVNTNNIMRISDYTFNVQELGTYLIQFQVSAEAGQLCLVVNGNEEPFTCVSQSSSGQLVGMSLIKTVVENTIISVRNPSASTPIIITPTSAHLIFLHIK
jgi:hypothetical protein